jgi:hypothetical protein
MAENRPLPSPWDALRSERAADGVNSRHVSPGPTEPVTTAGKPPAGLTRLYNEGVSPRGSVASGRREAHNRVCH